VLAAVNDAGGAASRSLPRSLTAAARDAPPLGGPGRRNGDVRPNKETTATEAVRVWRCSQPTTTSLSPHEYQVGPSRDEWNVTFPFELTCLARPAPPVCTENLIRVDNVTEIASKLAA
jgi:hypothetical protein